MKNRETMNDDRMVTDAMPRPPRGPGEGEPDQDRPIGDPPDEDETDDPDDEDEDEDEEDEEPLNTRPGARGVVAR